MALSIASFYGCCGVHIIAGFPYVEATASGAPKILETTETEFKKLWDLHKNYIVMCTLIEKQLAHEPMLRKYGFRQVSSTIKNPNSSNRLVMFLSDKRTLKEIKESRFKKAA